MTDSLPLVYICIPAYNAETTIEETLSTTLQQTYSNFRVLLLDNASTDRTVEIAESFKDERLVIYPSKMNIGAVDNFNRCIELGGGKYTIIFHADEVYEPSIVAQQVEVLEKNSEVGAVFSEAFLINSESKIFGETMISSYVGRNKGEVVRFTYEELFPIILRSGNFLLCSGAMVRTEIYKNEIQSWRDDLFSTSCDLDVWLRILERHQIALILKNLMRTRTSQTQASYTELKRNTNRADMFLVLDYYLKKPRSEGVVKKTDLAGYEILQRMDTARRTMNLYMMERFGEAADLLQENMNLALFTKLFTSKRGLFTFLLTLYLKVVLVLRLNKVGPRILKIIASKIRH